MLIALNGPPGVGKTTAAKLLQEERGVNPVVLVTPFYEFVRDNLGLTDKDMEAFKDIGVYFDENGRKEFRSFDVGMRTLRQAQIDVASALEKIDPTVWVRRAIQNSYKPGTWNILDSVGKRSQAAWLRNQMSWRVVVLQIRDADHRKYTKPGVQYTDGRHEISDPNFNVSNIHPDHRHPGTLVMFHQQVLDEFDRIKKYFDLTPWADHPDYPKTAK